MGRDCRKTPSLYRSNIPTHWTLSRRSNSVHFKKHGQLTNPLDWGVNLQEYHCLQLGLLKADSTDVLLPNMFTQNDRSSGGVR